MPDLSQIVGQRVRSYRQKAHITQEVLAERSGLHQTYIGQVERGEKNLTLNSLEKILSALELSLPEFFQGLGSSTDSTASQCYEIILNQTEYDQQRILRILQELDLLHR